MAKRWKMLPGALGIALAWVSPAMADVVPLSKSEIALIHNPTGLLVRVAAIVLFGLGLGLILYGLYGGGRKKQRK